MDDPYPEGLVLKRTISATSVIKFIIDLLILAAVIATYWIYRAASTPMAKGFFCDDEFVRYPIREETMSYTSVMIACICFPILSVIILEILMKLRFLGKFYSLVSLVKFIGFFLFGFFASLILCELGRKEIGRLRPSFWQICMPTYDQAACTAGKYIDNYDCVSNATAAEIDETRTDGNSSHSTMLAYTAVWMCVFIHYRIKNFRRSLMMRVALQIAFVTVAFWGMMTRMSDNQHSWTAVFAGGLIGTMGAVWVLLCSAEDLDYSFEGAFLSEPAAVERTSKMYPARSMPTKDIYYGSSGVSAASNQQRVTVGAGKGFTSAYISENNTAPPAGSSDMGKSRFVYESRF